jgi:hypothetical protein
MMRAAAVGGSIKQSAPRFRGRESGTPVDLRRQIAIIRAWVPLLSHGVLAPRSTFFMEAITASASPNPRVHVRKVH